LQHKARTFPRMSRSPSSITERRSSKCRCLALRPSSSSCDSLTTPQQEHLSKSSRGQTLQWALAGTLWVATASTSETSPSCFVGKLSAAISTSNATPRPWADVAAKGKKEGRLLPCGTARFGHDRCDHVHERGEWRAGDSICVLEKRDEFADSVACGLSGVQRVTSDAHVSPKDTITANLP